MDRPAADQVVLDFLTANDIAVEETEPHTFVITLPGTRKLVTTASVIVGAKILTVVAFVARRPDENHEAVYRWLLRRNARMLAVGFALDELGDIYLVGRMPVEAITAEGIDLIIGAVLENSDETFNTILEMGFASAIRREWEWRTARGESTANLSAFAHLAESKATDS
jgi:hypothetical protein